MKNTIAALVIITAVIATAITSYYAGRRDHARAIENAFPALANVQPLNRKPQTGWIMWDNWNDVWLIKTDTAWIEITTE